MKTIAIANQKGGTGKTTTTYNLGIALTQQGYRVLMVDFDPQGNLSCYCGIPPEKDLDQTITELLMKTSCEKPIGNRECVYQTGRKEAAARVDFIPSNLRLAGFELAMGTMMCREVLLKSCLEQYNNQYDYCLIDCSPSVGLLLTNALAAANEIIIPMQAQPFSVVGMSQLTSSLSLELVIERVHSRHLRLHSLCQRSRFCHNLTLSGFVNVPGKCRNQQCCKNRQNHQYNNELDKREPVFRILLSHIIDILSGHFDVIITYRRK